MGRAVGRVIGVLVWLALFALMVVLTVAAGWWVLLIGVPILGLSLRYLLLRRLFGIGEETTLPMPLRLELASSPAKIVTTPSGPVVLLEDDSGWFSPSQGWLPTSQQPPAPLLSPDRSTFWNGSAWRPIASTLARDAEAAPVDGPAGQRPGLGDATTVPTRTISTNVGHALLRDDASAWWDGTDWRPTSATVPATLLDADGSHWWNGVHWVRLGGARPAPIPPG